MTGPGFGVTQLTVPPMHSALVLAIGVATVTLAVAALSAGARRVLGLRIGLLRAVLSGLAGVVAAVALGDAAARASVGVPVFVTAEVGSALFASMGVLALSEVLLPGGAVSSLVRLPWELRRRIVRAGRYLEITAIARRHGLGRLLRSADRALAAGPSGHPELARSLRAALEEGGVTFVKLGQLLSMRYDLLPPRFTQELSLLQHQASPAPWPEVAEQLTKELGGPPDVVFAEFDREPLAAGSIAQAHRARLHTGQRVVVKVRRPGCRPVVERDLDILCSIARKLEDRTAWARATGTYALAEGFAASVMEELDFRIEARNMIAVAAVAAADRPAAAPGGGRVVVPAVHRALSTEKVLVVDWLDGVALGSLGPAAAVGSAGTADPPAAARALLDCVMRQILVGGIFHSDPHPGNVLLMRDGGIGLLDFGSVGRIDAGLRSGLGDMLFAIHRGDAAALCDALLRLVDDPEEIDARCLERSLGDFLARNFSPGLPLDLTSFGELFRLVSRFRITVPNGIAAAFRSLATLDSTLTRIDPRFDLMAESKAFLRARTAEKAAPAALARTVTEELLAVLPMLRRLPRRLDRITTALEEGRLTVGVRLLGDRRDRAFVQHLVHEGILTVLAATTGVMAVLLLGASGGPRVTGSVSLFQVLGYNLILASALLMVRVLFTVVRRQH